MSNKNKILITGSNGFVGGWLADLLVKRDCELYGMDIQERSLHRVPGSYHQIDITDIAATGAVIEKLRPETVYHLAGVSYLPQADNSPQRSIEINISGTVSLLEGVRKYSPSTRILLVGSSKEYDSSIFSDGISERTSPRPTNFYGITKYAGEMFGLQYHRQFGMDVRCSRSFNHTGPGQSSNFVCSDWARQIARIALGLSEPEITVGEIGATIDFTDVRDVTRAYRAIMESGKPGEVYNVCSGNGVSLSWIIDYLCRKAPIPVSVRYVEEKKRLYKSNTRMIGTHSRLTSHTGWKPEIPFQQTLDDLFDWWMEKLDDSGK